MTEWERDCLHWRDRVLTGDFGHYCAEFDGLPVDETCGEEWESVCMCHTWRITGADGLAIDEHGTYHRYLDCVDSHGYFEAPHCPGCERQICSCAAVGYRTWCVECFDPSVLSYSGGGADAGSVIIAAVRTLARRAGVSA